MAWIIDYTMDVNAPVEVVWEVVVDVQRYRDWNPFVIDCTSTLQPGDAIDMQVRLGRKVQHQVEWIVENQHERKLAYRMKPVPLGALSSYRSHELESIGAGVTRYRSHFELHGWLRPVVRLSFGQALHDGFEGMSNGIKARAEALWAQRSRKSA